MGILRRYRVHTSARSIDFFLDRDPDDPRFDMDQPYQRGLVWGVTRKRNLIKSILMGVPIPAIVVNDRFGAGFTNPGYSQARNWMYAVVDGKQRITAVQQFMDGIFGIPGEWVDAGPGIVLCTELGLPFQRGLRNVPLPVAEGHFKTLAQEQELFDLINFGGVAQGEVDEDAHGIHSTA